MANQELVNDMRLEAKIDGDLTYHYTSEPDFTGRAGRQNRQIWRRDELLGRGGFGEVWLERCVPNQGQNELRAVKIIPRPREDDSEGLHLLEQELQAIAKFSQPKYKELFVESRGWFETTHYIFIAMEAIELRDLGKHLKEPLLEDEARCISSQLLRGLVNLHKNNFVHRDLNPNNIFVKSIGPDWWVKIGDFGLSNRYHRDLALKTLCGTQDFRAPELVFKKPYTNAVDVWSLGVTIYFILSLELPFRESGSRSLSVYTYGTSEFPYGPLSSRSISQDGQRFIESLLRVDPTTRPPAKHALTDAWLRRSVFDSGSKVKELTKLASRLELNEAGQVSVPKAKHASSSKQDGFLASLTWSQLDGSLSTSYIQPTRSGRPSDGNRSKFQSSRTHGKEREAPAEAQYAAFVPNADEDLSRLQESHQGKVYLSNNRSRMFHDHSQKHSFDQGKGGKAEDIRRQVSGGRRDILSPNTNSHPRAQSGRSLPKHWQPAMSEDPDEEGSISDEGQILDHASTFSRYNESEENPGPKYGDPFTSHHCQGHKFWDEKKYTEAEKEYQKAYNGRRDTLGANHHDTLRSLSFLGDCLFKQHKDVQAEKAYQDLLKAQKRRWAQSIKRHLGLFSPSAKLSIAGPSTAKQKRHFEVPTRATETHLVEIIEKRSGLSVA
ncbi:hypothetical protein N7541_002430 [Penicillium brevicompactum]|uniref:Protein kinase domain-containing protein n=1 Tax=Penicillium brevicompactum TaxID=5074 RepID=A0A9W9V0F5_PENBR|nr:hypothetical protein N7541_002430 [Penicillium brevicompactum]